jgi:hypothetical protein
MTSTDPVRPRLPHTPPPTIDRRAPPEVRLSRLTADIAVRLKPVCDGMPAAEFDALVQDIARVKLRWSEEG